MKKSLLSLLLLISISTFAQTSGTPGLLDDYKYAIVPATFEIFKEADKFRLNTNTKLFMEKYGFTTYFDNQILPTEVGEMSCNRVFVNLVEEKSMFNTKIRVVLKDCRNNIIFTSATGTSREKDYKTAYNKALRAAFNSFDALNHKYNGNNDRGVKNAVEVAETVVLKEDFEKPISSDSSNVTEAVLNAQAIPNGFQLVDTTPKIILKIFRTSNPDVYIASNDTANGVFVKKNGQWFFEYYQSNKLFSQQINVKF